MNTLAVFKSRNEALKLYKSLNEAGIACITLNTPPRLNVGCGLSVAFSSALKDKVNNKIAALQLMTFLGFFRM